MKAKPSRAFKTTPRPHHFNRARLYRAELGVAAAELSRLPRALKLTWRPRGYGPPYGPCLLVLQGLCR